jgi:hypothetical protein
MMNEHGKSDRPIVPGKSPNQTRTAAAEEMEGRGLANESAMMVFDYNMANGAVFDREEWIST